MRPTLLLLLTLALTACGSEEAPVADSKAFALSEAMQQRIRIDTVRERAVENAIELNGRIAPDEGRLAKVYPIVGGQVTAVNVELGDRVTKGQQLVVIRSSEVADLERKMIDARSDMEVAEKNLSTKQDLFDSHLLSERKLVEARYDLEKAKAKLKRMEEVFSIYRFQEGSQYVVTAPISGYVIDKAITRDITLPEGHTDPIFTIAELSEVWVLADVYESDIARVKEGMSARITTLSYPDSVFTGKVDRIINMLDPHTRTMRIRIALPNPDVLLKPEMIARVRLSYQASHSLPAIPADAVIFDNSKQYVIVYKDERNLSVREISVQQSDGRSAWISEGLSPGETVIGREQLFLFKALTER